MKCRNRNHRGYQAKRKPRVACEDCWRMWFAAEQQRQQQRTPVADHPFSGYLECGCINVQDEQRRCALHR